VASEPAYVRAFREFTKSAPTADDIGPMEEEFYGQNDRACGILFGGWIDLALVSAIKSTLRPDLTSGLEKDLFDFEGPLGTFSSRINLAYALLIFGEKTKHDLELIRLIRNQFAHCRLPLRFEVPEVSAVCAHLQLPDTDQTTNPFMFASLGKMYDLMQLDDYNNPKHPKTRFLTCCHSIVHGLLDFARRPERSTLHASRLP
jgi:hypothetical protein